jgi:acyl-[acyl-carrier-protein] desaturase
VSALDPLVGMSLEVLIVGSTSTTGVLRELIPVVEANLNRHLSVAQEWMPHDYVPWTQGRDFAGQEGAAWAAEQSELSPAVQAAFEVNLLTEDNLPSYHYEIATAFGRDGAWGTWVHRWTAEEGRHAMCIRDYLLTTRGVDPDQLERDRMAVMQAGYSAEDKDPLRALAYVSFQELATRIAHRNTGRLAGEPRAEKLLARVATDENLHMVFYRDLVRAALEIAPDAMVSAVAAEVIGFAMPGTVIPGFTRKSVRIAEAGIYDVRIHRDEVVAPVLRYWSILDLDLSDPRAREAQRSLAAHLDELDRLATMQQERREAREARRQSAVG